LGNTSLEGQPTLGPPKLLATAFDRGSDGRLAEVDDWIVVIARSPARHDRSMPHWPYRAITARPARSPSAVSRPGRPDRHRPFVYASDSYRS